jgi:hypothetical protein
VHTVHLVYWCWSERRCADGLVTTINNVFFLSLLLLLPNVTFLPEGFIVRFWNFAWAPNSQKYKDSTKKNYSGTPPYPPKKGVFGQTRGGKFSEGSETLYMTFYGLGEIILCNSADMCTEKCPFSLTGLSTRDPLLSPPSGWAEITKSFLPE